MEKKKVHFMGIEAFIDIAEYYRELVDSITSINEILYGLYYMMETGTDFYSKVMVRITEDQIEQFINRAKICFDDMLIYTNRTEDKVLAKFVDNYQNKIQIFENTVREYNKIEDEDEYFSKMLELRKRNSEMHEMVDGILKHIRKIREEKDIVEESQSNDEKRFYASEEKYPDFIRALDERRKTHKVFPPAKKRKKRKAVQKITINHLGRDMTVSIASYYRTIVDGMLHVYETLSSINTAYQNKAGNISELHDKSVPFIWVGFEELQQMAAASDDKEIAQFIEDFRGKIFEFENITRLCSSKTGEKSYQANIAKLEELDGEMYRLVDRILQHIKKIREEKDIVEESQS